MSYKNKMIAFKMLLSKCHSGRFPFFQIQINSCGLNTIRLTVRGEIVEPPAAHPEPFDKLSANGVSLGHL